MSKITKIPVQIDRMYVFYLSVSSVLKPEIFGDAKAMGHLKIIYFIFAILEVL